MQMIGFPYDEELLVYCIFLSERLTHHKFSKEPSYFSPVTKCNFPHSQILRFFLTKKVYFEVTIIRGNI